MLHDDELFKYLCLPVILSSFPLMIVHALKRSTFFSHTVHIYYYNYNLYTEFASVKFRLSVLTGTSKIKCLPSSDRKKQKLSFIILLLIIKLTCLMRYLLSIKLKNADPEKKTHIFFSYIFLFMIFVPSVKEF